MELFYFPKAELICKVFASHGPSSFSCIFGVIEFLLGSLAAGAALTEFRLTEKANMFRTRAVHEKGHCHINHI